MTRTYADERARELLADLRDAVIAEMVARYGPGCSSGVAAIMLHDSLPETFTRENWKAWFFKPATGAFDWAIEHKLIEPVAAWRMTPLGLAVSERMRAENGDKPTPQPDSDLVEKVARVLYGRNPAVVMLPGSPEYALPWEQISDDDHAEHLGDARAILAALPRTYADGIEDAARALKAWEDWEAAVILDPSAWSDQHGFAVEGDNYDRYIELQDLRNAAIRTLSTSPSGIEDAREAEACHHCSGTGKLHWEHSTVGCGDCGGTGAPLSDAREALTKAAAAFRMYEQSHQEKADEAALGLSHGEYLSRVTKAERNRALAEMCESASSKIGGDHG